MCTLNIKKGETLKRLVLNLLEDAVGRLARARVRLRTAALQHLPTDLKLILFEGKLTFA